LVARQAQHDATSAYNDLAARTCATTLPAGFGGLTLGPGVYCVSSPAQLTGPLILDAANDPNAVWIFRIGGTLTTATGSSVRVINNGYEGNIFWQVGDSVTLNAGTTFVGNVLAHNDITLHAGASISGRGVSGWQQRHPLLRSHHRVSGNSSEWNGMHAISDDDVHCQRGNGAVYIQRRLRPSA
jgi:hypothetical protein